jgi:excisionase family DNA binding protein
METVMAQTTDQPSVFPDVLTLAEAAAYLRVSEAEIVELTRRQALPGRKVGDQWRFLKAAIQEWLRLPEREGVSGDFGRCTTENRRQA